MCMFAKCDIDGPKTKNPKQNSGGKGFKTKLNPKMHDYHSLYSVLQINNNFQMCSRSAFLTSCVSMPCPTSTSDHIISCSFSLEAKRLSNPIGCFM